MIDDDILFLGITHCIVCRKKKKKKKKREEELKTRSDPNGINKTNERYTNELI